jgi:hypothetical protein
MSLSQPLHYLGTYIYIYCISRYLYSNFLKLFKFSVKKLNRPNDDLNRKNCQLMIFCCCAVHRAADCTQRGEAGYGQAGADCAGGRPSHPGEALLWPLHIRGKQKLFLESLIL